MKGPSKKASVPLWREKKATTSSRERGETEGPKTERGCGVERGTRLGIGWGKRTEVLEDLQKEWKQAT